MPRALWRTPHYYHAAAPAPDGITLPCLARARAPAHACRAPSRATPHARCASHRARHIYALRFSYGSRHSIYSRARRFPPRCACRATAPFCCAAAAPALRTDAVRHTPLFARARTRCDRFCARAHRFASRAFARQRAYIILPVRTAAGAYARAARWRACAPRVARARALRVRAHVARRASRMPRAFRRRARTRARFALLYRAAPARATRHRAHATHCRRAAPPARCAACAFAPL